MRQLRRLSDLGKFSLRARDGEIGAICGACFAAVDWTVRHLIVRTGGWLHGREVLLAPRMISGVDDQERRIGVEIAREQVEQLPPRSATQPELRASDDVRGFAIRARDGEIGSVGDFVLDDQDWALRYFVADTGTWLPGRQLLIAPAWIDGVDPAARRIVVALDTATVQSAPPYDPAQVISRDYEVGLYKHYGQALQEHSDPR